MHRYLFDFLTKYALVLVLVIVVAGFSLTNENFLSVNNLRAIGVNQVVVLFVALAVSAALSVGEIDLSLANILGLSQAVTVGMMSFSGLGVIPAILVGLLAAAVVGLINGLLVVRLGLNSLVATLAMSSVLTGVVIWYTRGTSIYEGVPSGFKAIANGDLFSIPLPLIYAIVALLISEIIFGFLPTGRRMYAIGGNRRAAQLSGIHVQKIVLLTFVSVAVIAGLGGTIISSRLGAASPDMGPTFLLPAFAAAFLGSTVIRPGRFNPLGTAVAVYLIAFVVSGMQQMGAPSWSQYIFNGVALALGVTISLRLVRLREATAKRAQLRSFEASTKEAA